MPVSKMYRLSQFVIRLLMLDLEVSSDEMFPLQGLHSLNF